MKKELLFCCALFYVFDVSARIYLPSSIRSNSAEYVKNTRVTPSHLINNPLVNTIAYNYGDSIIGLVTPPIGDQGPLGSCNAWALGYGCGSIMAFNAYQDMNWAKRSASFLFNLNNNLVNSDSASCFGSEARKIAYRMYTHGICSEFLFPYDSTECMLMPNSVQLTDAAYNKYEYTHLDNRSNIQEYRQLLRAGYPIGVTTYYITDLQRIWNNPDSIGIWRGVFSDTTSLGHTLCIVGFDDHQHLFKAMNSWDSIKGDHGFVWIDYDLVSNGVFDETYVFDSYSNGFVPQIQGSTYFCGPEECYSVANVPAGCSYSWSINSNYTPGDIISSGQGTSSVCIQANGLTPAKGDDRLLPGLPRSVLSVTISDPNNSSNTYSTSKSIYNPSPKPTVSASNTATNWTVGTTRTFTITNCSSVSFSNLQWIIKKTVYPLFGNPTIYTDTIYGKYMTYTPTWTSGATSITIDITATNLARHCEDNYVLLSFNVVRKLLLKATDTGDYLDVAISDTETESSLYHIEFNANSLYTLELWHPMYGLMRTKPAYNANEQIDINGLPQGVYILLLKENNHIIAQTKVII